MINTIFSPLKGFGKKKLFLIFFLLIVATFLEVISIGAVLPIISALVEDSTKDIFFFNFLSNYFTIDNKESFIKIVSILILMIFTIKFVLMSYITLICNLFTANVSKFISKKILNIYLNKNLIWHSNFNKSSFLNLIITEVAKYTGHCINPLFHIIIDCFLFLGIIFILAFVNLKIFTFLFLISLFVFLALYFFSKTINYKLGKIKLTSSQKIFVFLNENLAGIKEVILYSGGKFIVDTFLKLFKENLRVSALHTSFGDIIRFLIEILGLILILAVFYILITSDNVNKSLTLGTLGMYAAALFRILLIYNRISTYSQKMQFGLAAGEKVNEFLENNVDKFQIKSKKNIELKDNLSLKNISFRFKDKDSLILDNINLEIKKNELVGIAGKSGSGKTTLTNIIMDLIEPTSGEVLIDNLDIKKNNLSYTKKIGFISQNFFYTDDTIINNIILGKENIKFNDLRFALKNSLLSKAIVKKELSLKSNMGNAALKVSGGQLQRVNLARALYRKPKILILDEPTSALDIKTQDELGKIICNLKKNMTIILISHNEKILSFCDSIYWLENGKLTKNK